ncbi:hypothetical protein JTB14_002653 [Gonioctena quinquepunctata]|nr:hypothetical protein JTB14_002653 [Gonioctena quinquepunctata]
MINNKNAVRYTFSAFFCENCEINSCVWSSEQTKPMGLSTSKSPLERRNTVLKRSQRRTIHMLTNRIERTIQNIKKFRGTDVDEDYRLLKQEIGQINNELLKKTRDLQPQVRNVHQITCSKIQEAFDALEEKVKENIEKNRKKEEEAQEKQKQKEEKSKKNKEKQYDESDEVSQIMEDGVHEQHIESEKLAHSTEKRQTVELKFIKVEAEDETEVDVHSKNSTPLVKSPEEKRKSILKMGVPVMPGAMLSEMTKKLQIASPQEEPNITNGNFQNILGRISDVIEELEAIEYQIADFVGKRNGTQYNRIKDKLGSFHNKVSRLHSNDDYTSDQIKVCKNYIMSCLNFLDEKAVDEKGVVEGQKLVENDTVVEKYNNDVFLPESNNNDVLSPLEVNMKLQKLTKTTAI